MTAPIVQPPAILTGLVGVTPGSMAGAWCADCPRCGCLHGMSFRFGHSNAATCSVCGLEWTGPSEQIEPPRAPAAPTLLPNSVNMAAAASWYASHGLRIFPLHGVVSGRCSCGKSACPSAGKHPITPRGFKDATADAAQVEAWWQLHPHANIGIPTGGPSGLLVVDCDPRNGGPSERSDFVEQFGPVPETGEVSTGGGGRHFYFRYPGGPVPKALAEGVDLKGEGGYVVAPPSLHLSGKRYEADGIDAMKLLLNPAPIPEWLEERLAAHQRQAVTPPAPAAPPLVDYTGKLLSRATMSASTEGRNTAGSWLAMQLRDQGLTEADARAPMAEYVRRVAEAIPKDHPYTFEEALASLKSAYTRPAREPWKMPTNSINVQSANTLDEKLVLLNALAIWRGKIRWVSFSRRGNTIIGITANGEQVRWQAENMLVFSKAQSAIWQATGITIPTPSPREVRRRWEEAAELIGALLQYDTQDRGGVEENLRLELQQVFSRAGSPEAATSNRLIDILFLLKTYRREAYAENAPPAVFLWEGSCWVHVGTLRSWLGTVSGGNLRYSVGELREWLGLLGFKREKLDRMKGSDRVALDLWRGPADAATGGEAGA